MNYSRISLIPILLLIISCNENSTTATAENGQNDEWITIFNGENLDGWIPKIHRHETGDNYAETFRVTDGMVEVNYDGYDIFENRYGHLFYEKPYSSFHLTWEYRFTDQWMEDAPSYTYRNSGVMFHSQDPHTINKDQDWPISVEFQMLAEAKEGEKRPTGAVCTPGTEVHIDGALDERHCIDSSAETFPWDQWVKADLIVYGDSLIIHMINGDTVLQYTHPRIGSSGVVNNYDPEIKKDGTTLKSGYISLQGEGQGVLFKDIRIREL